MVVLDLEMTGLDPEIDKVCEVAYVRAEGARIVDTYSSLVRPLAPMKEDARRVHGISDEELSQAPLFADIAEEVCLGVSGAVMVGHNIPFDLVYLHREMDHAGVEFRPPITLDTLLMSRRLFAFPRNNLLALCRRLQVDEPGHRALSDARATFLAFRKMVEIVDPGGVSGMTVEELVELLGALAPNSPMRLRQKRLLRDAYSDRRTVVIDYQSTSDPAAGLVRREVGIWLLKLPYIQGWCFLRGGERVFRLDRIRTVNEAERDYEIPDFDRRI